MNYLFINYLLLIYINFLKNNEMSIFLYTLCVYMGVLVYVYVSVVCHIREDVSSHI